jgi:hypothetical protein
MPDRGDLFVVTYRATADGSAEKGRLALVAVTNAIHIRRVYISGGGAAYTPGWRLCRGTAIANGTKDLTLLANLDGRGGSPTAEAYKSTGATGITLTDEQVLYSGDIMAAGDGWVHSWPQEKFVISPVSDPNDADAVDCLCFFQPAGADITNTFSIEFQEE